MYKTVEKLNINSHIKLCFKKYVISLEQFFDSNIDNNAQKIISLDLSHFDSSLITNIDKLFSGCQELLALDLSNLNLKNIESSNDVFKDIQKLSYINTHNISNINNANLDAILKLNLIVCQRDTILESDNFKYICCDFNLEQKMCHSNNYITVKYIPNSNYSFGFKNTESKDIENSGFVNRK